MNTTCRKAFWEEVCKCPFPDLRKALEQLFETVATVQDQSKTVYPKTFIEHSLPDEADKSTTEE